MFFSPWIDLRCHLNDVVLQEYHRSYTTFQELAFPQEQDPQLIAFIGDKVKSRSLRNLFAVESQPGHSTIYLRLIPGYTQAQSPIFIADCELHNILNLKDILSQQKCGPVEDHFIRWHKDIPRALDPSVLASLVYTQLIIPFSHLLCLFADDFGDTASLARVLASWMITLSNRPQDLPSHTSARVVVLQKWKDPANTFDEKLATMSFKQQIRQEIDKRSAGVTQSAFMRMNETQFNKLLEQQFGDLVVLPLPFQSKDNGMQFKKLRKRILQESKDIRALRIAARVAFTAQHFKAFFQAACSHFASSIVTPFSFVEASRLSNPVSADFSSHISHFLRLSPKEHRMTFAAPVIASALCLDSHPQNMHRKSGTVLHQNPD